MYVFVAALVVAVLALVGGGYLGYRWGRKVEAKANAAIEAARIGAKAVVSAVKQ